VTLWMIGVMAAGAGVCIASATAVSAGLPLNPYVHLAEKNISGLSGADQTLDFKLGADTFASPGSSAQSKTCSQRCSTTCSTTCTTTRGCSSTCKRQTDGCGGGGSTRPPTSSPAPVVPSAILPAATAPSRSAIPAEVVIDRGARATALYHRNTCPWLKGAVTSTLTIEAARKANFQPHCLCLTGTDGPSGSCAATVEAAILPVGAEMRIEPDGIVRVPEKLFHVDPIYPESARITRSQGVVVVAVTVDTDGAVLVARIVRSLVLLDEPALAAVRQWRYRPTLVDNVPIAVSFTVAVSFPPK
jgi:TonB family protein